MNELKPEDVMRALECHIKRRCYKCPLGKEEIEDLSKPCSTMIAELALALLREKDATIADYTLQIAEMQKQIATQDRILTDFMKRKEIEADKDAEIERLKEQQKRLDEGLDTVIRASIQEVEGWKRHFDSFYKTSKETVRAEAIDEFAERLKALCVVDLMAITKEQALFCIDQIAKELKEGALNA